MKKTKRAFLLLLCLGLCLASPALANDTERRYVTASDAPGLLTLYKAADANSAVLAEFFSGAPCDITGPEKEGWQPVTFSSSDGGIKGYVQAESLSANSPQTSLPVAQVNNPDPTHGLNLRQSPSTRSRSLGKHYNGEEVELLGLLPGGWCQVAVLPDREMGYMMMEFLTLPEGVAQAVGTPAPQGTPEPEGTAAPEGTETPAGTALPDESTAQPEGTPEPEGTGQPEGTAEPGEPENPEGTTAPEGTAQSTGIPGPTAIPPTGEETNPTAQYAVVDNENPKDPLPLLIAPQADAQVSSLFENGTTVELLAQQGDWYRVRVGYSLGYMRADALRLDGSVPELVRLHYGIIAPQDGLETIPVHTGPSAATSVAWELPAGQRLRILDTAGTWYWVSIEGKGEGYIPSQYVLPGIQSADPEQSGRYGVVAGEASGLAQELRAEPDETSDSLGHYFNGTQVELITPPQTEDPAKWGAATGWQEVRVQGQQGYMPAPAIAPVQVEAPGE